MKVLTASRRRKPAYQALEAALGAAWLAWALCWLTFAYAPWLRRSDDRALFVVACVGQSPAPDVVDVCMRLAVEAIP